MFVGTYYVSLTLKSIIRFLRREEKHEKISDCFFKFLSFI